MPGTDQDATAQAVDAAVSGLAAHALILQGFAMSTKAQPGAELGASSLEAYQTGINDALATAKKGAKTYLDTVLPMAVETITNFGSYFDVQNQLAEALQEDANVQAAIAQLTAVQEQAGTYKQQSIGLVDDLRIVRGTFRRSATGMDEAAANLAVAIDGDDGALTSIASALGSLDAQIQGALTGVVNSGLTVSGGELLLGIGALAEAVTGGVSTAVVAGGVAIAAGGGGGSTASLKLAELLDLKSHQIVERAVVDSETTLAAGLSSGLKGLDWAAGETVTFAQSALDAWTRVSDDLGTLIADLEQGNTTTQAVAELFALTAQGEVAVAQADIGRIRARMTAANPTVDLSVTAGALVRALSAKAG
jgi:hypothetical protein